MKALFQMDCFSELNIKSDTSIAIIDEGLKLGCEIWTANPNKLSFFDNKVSISAKKVLNNNLDLSKENDYCLEDFDFFFIRQDPPFDIRYITNCYLLELHKSSSKKPFFINDPSGIKNFTEKIFPLYFNKFMPPTIITSDEARFMKMLEEFGTVVIKPLYCKGGEGISKINLNNKSTFNKFKNLIMKYKTPVVVQEFIDKVTLGDKRVIFVDGLPMGVVNRIPKSGAFKANLHLGGKAKKTELTAVEKKICSVLGAVFKKNNLFLVGIDLIDQKLTEINVTSPTGIKQIDDLYDVNLSREIWKKLKRYIA